MIYPCSTATKVHRDSGVPTVLIWVLRAAPVFVMPRCRDMNSGSSCAVGRGWNGAANGPNVPEPAQSCFLEARRLVVGFCRKGGFHPPLFAAEPWLCGGMPAILIVIPPRHPAAAGLEAAPIPATGTCYPCPWLLHVSSASQANLFLFYPENTANRCDTRNLLQFFLIWKRHRSPPQLG